MSTKPRPETAQRYSSLIGLFAEINAFAISLKKTASVLHHDDNLPSGGRAVLGLLKDHGPSTVPQIARRYASSRQNIQMVVNRLAQLQLLESEHNPAHKRSPVIRLSPEGTRLMARVAERESLAHAQLLAELRENEIHSATAFLKRARGMLVATEPYSKPTEKPRRSRRTEKRSMSAVTTDSQSRPVPPQPTPQRQPSVSPEPDEEEMPLSLL